MNGARAGQGHPKGAQSSRRRRSYKQTKLLVEAFVMKKAVLAVLALGVLSGALGGCAYGGVGVGAGDKVVIARNDAFLFGALRKVFVCKAADNGLQNCQNNESP